MQKIFGNVDAKLGSNALKAVAAAIMLSASWAASAAQDDQNQPAARAYFSYPFGGPAKNREPMHYGLRMDIQNRRQNFDGYLASVSGGRPYPALAQLDFDTGGNRLASFSGIPFAGRVVKLSQNEGDGSTPPADSSSGGGSGGFTFFDWTLLVVGLGGAGYLIYQVADNQDDH